MPESDSNALHRDAEVLAIANERAVFVGGDGGLIGLSGRLTLLAAELQGGQDGILALLAQIADYWLRPGDWVEPFGPAVSLAGRRTQIPNDLSANDLARLRSVVDDIEHPLLRGRVHDVLFLHASGAQRVDHAKSHIEAVLDSGISEEAWALEIGAWERAILVARRLSKATATQLALLEHRLRDVIEVEQTGFAALRAAELLWHLRRSAEHSQSIATRLVAIADSSRERQRARAYRESAAGWFRARGDAVAADEQIVLVVNSLVGEAEEIARSGDASGGARASHLFELALQRVRTLPRAVREREGVSKLPAHLARRIRELGAAQLETMQSFSSKSIDLADVANEAAESVADRPAPEALLQFAALHPLVDFAKEKSSAEELINKHPLSRFFSHITYTSDGRVVHRDSGQGGTPIYGVDPATWRQMVQSYVWRIGFLVQGMIWPAYVQLSNDHRLPPNVFETIVRGSAIVPDDRVGQFARGLYLGYTSDFATAAHLLVPQLENLVRVHLGNAGIATTRMENGVEHEVGLSTLMERDGVVDIFGADLCFELRALLCGPLGPNLRNELAHGLLSDAAASSVTTVYLWWFALRLVFVTFWNSRHDTDAAEAREPAGREGESNAS
ncbi:DUF4209 domain-containing protein [Agromyces sp. NPDC055520]